jgi:hypothetical protein
MANHGKRAPLVRMTVGDRILIYSAKTAFPDGDPFRAIAIVGTVTGAEPEPSAVIAGGFRLRANLREIEPIRLAEVRDHLPTNQLRFGCFELAPDSAEEIWKLVPNG